MRFSRHFIEELKRPTDAHELCRLQFRQQAVVVTLATPQPVPCPIERHTWNDGDIYLVVILWGKQSSLWLHDAKCTLPQGRLSFIKMQLQLFALHNGQKNTLAFLEGFTNQQSYIDFIA